MTTDEFNDGVGKHYHRMIAQASALVGRQDAADVTHDAVIAAMTTYPQIPAEGVHLLLRRYVRLRGVDLLRRRRQTSPQCVDRVATAEPTIAPLGGPAARRRRRQVSPARRRHTDQLQVEAAAVGRHFDPVVGAETAEAGRLITQAVAKLSAGRHQAFTMRLIQGMSIAEIAERLGVTEAAVYSLVYQAKCDLRLSLRHLLP